MLKYLIIAGLVASSALATPVSAAVVKTSPQCTIPGSIYVDIPDVGGECILHVTDVNEINKATPADTSYDPKCDGKPAGWKYDTQVTGPNGQSGIAHHVCGTRPQ